MQTLFQVGMKINQDVDKHTDVNLEEGESVGVSREQDGLYGNVIQANKESNSVTCTNMMDTDLNSGPGPAEADKNMDSKNQADSETEITKASSESMNEPPAKPVQNRIEQSNTGLVRLDIGFLTTEFPSQSDIEKYVTRGHIDFPLTFSIPKDDNNQTFPEGILKFRNINAEQHTRDWLV